MNKYFMLLILLLFVAACKKAPISNQRTTKETKQGATRTIRPATAGKNLKHLNQRLIHGRKMAGHIKKSGPHSPAKKSDVEALMEWKASHASSSGGKQILICYGGNNLGELEPCG